METDSTKSIKHRIVGKSHKSYIGGLHIITPTFKCQVTLDKIDRVETVEKLARARLTIHPAGLQTLNLGPLNPRNHWVSLLYHMQLRVA